MKENFCDIQKNMQAVKDLDDTKMFLKFIVGFFICTLLALCYMIYHYDKKNTEKKALIEEKASLDSLINAGNIVKVDTSITNNYYMVSIKDKKILKVLVQRGYAVDSTYLEPISSDTIDGVPAEKLIFN